MEIKKISVKASKNYDILIGSGIIKDTNNYIKDIVPSSKIVIVCDDKIKNTHLPALLLSLQQYNVHIITIKVKEKIKSLTKATNLCEEILNFKIDRKTTIIALGGGVLGDLVGFCASILLRGLPFILIPTTLLSQVDSSIGGKTGVNSFSGKNTIGTFKQPNLVLIDTDTLKTLTFKDYISGYSEALKCALLFDKTYFDYLLSRENKIKEIDSETILNIIEKSCKYKAMVIQQDEFETKEIRALLNLGHSFGHAFEKYNQYKPNLLHGSAVAIGMVLAFDFSNFIKIANINTFPLKQHLINVGLPTKVSDIFKNFNVEEIIDNMLLDKKNTNGQITLVLPKEIGRCEIIKNIDIISLKNFLIQKEKI